MIAAIATLIAQTPYCPLTDSLYKRSGEHRFGVLCRVGCHALTYAVKDKKRLEPSSMCRRWPTGTVGVCGRQCNSVRIVAGAYGGATGQTEAADYTAYRTIYTILYRYKLQETLAHEKDIFT